MLRRTSTTSFQNAIHSCYYQLYPHANADAGQRSTGKHHFRHGRHKRYPQPIIWIVAISTICSARLFEHENIDSSYKANGTIPIYIRHPKLALLLTGTPGQIDHLLSSYENGLPSRTRFTLSAKLRTGKKWATTASHWKILSNRLRIVSPNYITSVWLIRFFFISTACNGTV